MSDLRKNSQGGIDDHDKGAIERARSDKVDLITFPKDIPGTNCFNCIFITNRGKDTGYCENKHVRQYVNGRMCCNLWDRKGAIRVESK